MKLKAIKASALLCALFLFVYGSTNYLTSLRHDVGMFYFSWERQSTSRWQQVNFSPRSFPKFRGLLTFEEQ